MVKAKKGIFVSVKDIQQQKYTIALAEFLKSTGKIEQPEWVDLVKLSQANELAPQDSDWYFVRCASILRHLYNRSTGIHGLTKIFSRNKSNGSRPSHMVKGYSGIVRNCLKTLSGMGMVELVNERRILTSTGRRDLDRIAYQLKKAEKL